MRSGRAGALATLSFQWGRYVLQLVSLILLSRLLAPSDFGIVAMVTAIVGVASILGDLGLSLASIRAPELTHDQKTGLFWLNLLVGLVLGGVVALCADPIAALYGRPELAVITRLVAITFVLNGTAVQFSVELVRTGRLALLGGCELTAAVLGLAAAVTGAAVGAGYWALVLQALVTAAAVPISLAAASGWRPGLPRRGAGIRSFLSFGVDTSLVQVVNYATSNFDTIVVGRFFGAVTLGLYNRAFQIVALPVQQVVAPLTRVVLPRLSRADGEEEFDSMVLRLQRVMMLALIVPLSFIAGIARPLMVLLLGPEWAGGSAVLQVLAIGAGFQVAGCIYYWAFLAKGASRTLLQSEIWGRVLMIPLFIVAANLGVLWVAAVVGVGQLVIWCCSAFIYARRAGIRSAPLVRSSGAFLAVSAVAAAVAAAAAQIGDGPPAQLGLGTALWAVGASAVLVALPPIRREVLASVREALLVLQRRRDPESA